MPQILWSNINGQLIPTTETTFKSSNEAVRGSYGLYETMLLRNNQILHQELHWKRFWAGLNLLKFTIPKQLNETFFEQQIIELATKNNHSELGRIRLQVLAKNGIPPFEAQYYIETQALDSEIFANQKQGLKLEVLNNFTKPTQPESNFKISHSLHYPLAKAAIQAQNIDDVLLQNDAGNIIESAIANLFWIKENKIFTPPISDACLAGTMRSFLIKKMAEHQIAIIEKSVSLEVLLTADELFLCNSIRGIRWVASLCGTRFQHEMTMRIKALINPYKL